MTRRQHPQADLGRPEMDLLATLSHELRTPLNAIIGFAEMLAGDVRGDDEHQRHHEYARHIVECGTHLRDIISGVLDAISDHGVAYPPPAEPIDPAAAVDDCLDLVRAAAKAKGVRLARQAGDSRVRLLADRQVVARVLAALVQDAIAEARRGDRITVSVDLAAGSGELVYAIEGPASTARQEPGRRMAGHADHVVQLRPTPPDLAPAIWSWLVRLNGGRLDLGQSPDSGRAASIRFPGSMLRQPGDPVRGSSDATEI